MSHPHPRPHPHPHPPPDPRPAAHPPVHTDPDLKAVTDGIATDVIETVLPVMPLVIPAMGVLQIFMFAFVAICMA